MTTTPEIDAAREALAAAEAEVDHLRAKLRAELAAQDARGLGEERQETRLLTAADGRAEAQRRYGRRDDAAATKAADETPTPGASAADGLAEARRRIAARRG